LGLIPLVVRSLVRFQYIYITKMIIKSSFLQFCYLWVVIMVIETTQYLGLEGHSYLIVCFLECSICVLFWRYDTGHNRGDITFYCLCFPGYVWIVYQSALIHMLLYLHFTIYLICLCLRIHLYLNKESNRLLMVDK